MKATTPGALLFALFAFASLSAPALADLDRAKHFAILSGGALQFGSGDVVTKAPNASAPTCPAGNGCPYFVGGTSIAPGSNNKIGGSPTTKVLPAVQSLASYGNFLSRLPVTTKMGAIVLKPGSHITIQAGSGLNVITTPEIVLGTTTTSRPPDPCAPGKASPASIAIVGSASASVVFNIGSSTSPGALILCDGSVITLDGVRPDRVTFNVLGKSTHVAMGDGSVVDGSIVAPLQTFYSENALPGGATTTLNGGIFVGGAATIGNGFTENFYPSQEIGMPVSVKYLGTVDVSKLPPPVKAKTTLESEDNPPQPLLAVPRMPVQTALKPSSLMPASRNPGAAHRPALSLFTTFAALSQNGKTPPDEQLAAGKSTLIEMVNVTGAIYSNPGGALIRTFDLGQFFAGNPGQGTDPRIYYDAATGNFIAAYELGETGGDDIRLAISSNPGNSWAVYDVAGNNTGAQFDQPKLGVGSDKITLSWNNYKTQTGTSYIVIQKSGIVARASSVPAWIWTDDTSRFQIVPVNSLSADSGTQYAGWRCCGMSNFDVMAFTGVPGVSPVSYTDTAYGIGGVTGPPPARQPSGGDPTINTDDDRLLSAVWQAGVLWGDFNEGCTPSNDRTQRACERFVEISPLQNHVLQNVQLQATGDDIYYSAASLDLVNDRSPDLFFGITLSSPTIYPEAIVSGVPGGNFTSVTGGTIYEAGTAAFHACALPPPATNKPCPRWGDYTATARDPNDPTKMWVVTEYGGLSSPSGFWGTGITEVHI